MRFSDAHGYYDLVEFPGCHYIICSLHAFIRPQERGRGFGGRQHRQRLAKAKELGYKYIICTVVECNELEKHILISNGWKKLSQVEKPDETGFTEIWGRQL